jgi:glycosyltransferase involved in cell wall biosynthesis
MRDLSIVIPARNEQFLSRTIEDILSNLRGDTEVIAVCDGYWPNPPIIDNPRVTIIHHSKPIGQRQSTNEGAKLSTAKFIMKCDAHCAFDKDFDVKLMETCEKDWTVVPRMYNLHVYDWLCKDCGHRTYQAHDTKCEKCNSTNVVMDIVWKRRRRPSDYMWFDPDLRFRYFDSNAFKLFVKGQLDSEYKKKLKRKYHHKYRDWAKGEITDQMCCIGACWMMHRDRYWEIEGMDEGHGGWGQMGVELACKSWLSGGRQVVNKTTWFAHLFRTTKTLRFPYSLSGKETSRARDYSRDLWLNNKWDKAIHPLSWMIERFGPLPGWDKKEIENG